MQVDPTLKQSVDHAFKAIAKVHGSHDFDVSIPVRPIKGGTFGLQGRFVFYPGKHPEAVEISPRAERPEITALHELGHVIEGFGLPGNEKGRRQWEGRFAEPIFRDWMDAVTSTEAYGRLEALSDKKSTTIDGKSYKVSEKHVEYLTRWDELFARSYAQWVTTRSGDKTLVSQLNDLRDAKKDPLYHSRHWSDQDFEPVAAALDQLFRAAKWKT